MSTIIFSIIISLLFSNSWFLPSFFTDFNQSKTGVFSAEYGQVNQSSLMSISRTNTDRVNISADKAAVLEADHNFFLYEKNSEQQQPIASITKLMTAIVIVDSKPSWQKVYEIQRTDRREGGRIHLYLGDQVTMQDLFYLSLVGSANTATAALVSSLGVSEEEFVALMNQKAKNLGMFDSQFADPVGLSENNLSTARDVAILVREALNRPEIAKAVTNSDYTFTTVQGDSRSVDSTDLLLGGNLPQNLLLVGGKTGYIPQAGYCFGAEFKYQDQPHIITVVLGADDILQRFQDTLILASWAYNF